MSSDSVTFRAAEANDAEFLAPLLGQLGYPADVDEVPGRLEALAQFPMAAALVAVIGKKVIGLITIHVFPSLHVAQPVAWITSLVVDSEHRGQGIGSALVGEAERWARENRAKRISVSSALHREETHRFYEVRNYLRTGLRFTKTFES
jgi:GNAT superfamily N-acetyltransferase